MTSPLYQENAGKERGENKAIKSGSTSLIKSKNLNKTVFNQRGVECAVRLTWSARTHRRRPEAKVNFLRPWFKKCTTFSMLASLEGAEADVRDHWRIAWPQRTSLESEAIHMNYVTEVYNSKKIEMSFFVANFLNTACEAKTFEN